MARDIIKWVVPNPAAVGKWPIISSETSGHKSIRDAIVGAWEQWHGPLVCDYKHYEIEADGSSSGCLCQEGYTLNYRVKTRKQVGSNNKSSWYFDFYYSTVGGYDINVDVVLSTGETISDTLANSTTLVKQTVGGRIGDDSAEYIDISFSCPADLYVQGFVVYDSVSLTEGPSGAFEGTVSNDLVFPEYGVWDASQPCSLTEYWDLVYLLRYMLANWGSGQAVALSNARKSKNNERETIIRIPVPPSPVSGLDNKLRVWGYNNGGYPGSVSFSIDGYENSGTKVISPSSWAFIGDFVIPYYGQNEIICRLVNGNNYADGAENVSVSAYWYGYNLDELTVPNTTITYPIIDENGDYLVDPDGNRVAWR